MSKPTKRQVKYAEYLQDRLGLEDFYDYELEKMDRKEISSYISELEEVLKEREIEDSVYADYF